MRSLPDSPVLSEHAWDADSPLSAFTRPFLRPDVPLIWVDEDVVRIGAAEDAPRVRCTRSQVAWLSTLDGTGSGPVRVEVGDGSDPRALVSAAIAAGAIDDAARMPQAWRWLSPDRRWALQPALLAACHTYGNDAGNRVMDRRLAISVHVPGRHALALAVRSQLEQAGLEVAEQAPASCTVLAGGVSPAGVDPSLAHALDGPHLPLRVFGARAQVGPLVIPGQTACLQCEALRRSDRHPGWVSEQAQALAHEASLRVRPEDPFLLAAAALHAVALIRAWVDGVTDEWRDRLLTIALPTLEVERHAITRHPLCGCAWPVS